MSDISGALRPPLRKDDNEIEACVSMPSAPGRGRPRMVSLNNSYSTLKVLEEHAQSACVASSSSSYAEDEGQCQDDAFLYDDTAKRTDEPFSLKFLQ